MPADRSRPSRPGPGSRSGRPSGGARSGGGSRPGRKPGAGDGSRGGRPGAGSGGARKGRPDTRRGAGDDRQRSGGRAGGKPGGKPGGARRGGKPGGPRRDERSAPEPRTEAEKRAAEVRARRPPRTPRDPAAERAKIESREVEVWLDEGSIRSEAQAATRRAASNRDRPDRKLDPEVVAEIHDATDPKRAARLAERLAVASAALDRERFEEARRLATSLARELPDVAAVHEVAGLAAYRTGRWKLAVASLELAQQLRPDPALLPVIADSYRAMRRWKDVDRVWSDVRAASPTHDVMAEARIVAAGALADRGELREAINLMTPATKPPKRVRDHHLRQWYVLGDLYDRAGDPVAAARWFGEVARRDPDFADVGDRLRALGR